VPEGSYGSGLDKTCWSYLPWGPRPSKGITPGIDKVAPADSAATPEVKKEFVGGVLTHNNDGNDQPDPISRLHIGATFYVEDEDADDFIHPICRKGALYDVDGPRITPSATRLSHCIDMRQDYQSPMSRPQFRRYDFP